MSEGKAQPRYTRLESSTHAGGKVPNKERWLSRSRSQGSESVAVGSGANGGARCDAGGGREHCMFGYY